MRIMRLGEAGKEQPAVMVPSHDAPDRYFSLLPLTADVDGPFLADGGLGRCGMRWPRGACRSWRMPGRCALVLRWPGPERWWASA